MCHKCIILPNLQVSKVHKLMINSCCMCFGLCVNKVLTYSKGKLYKCCGNVSISGSFLTPVRKFASNYNLLASVAQDQQKISIATSDHSCIFCQQHANNYCCHRSLPNFHMLRSIPASHLHRNMADNFWCG